MKGISIIKLNPLALKEEDINSLNLDDDAMDEKIYEQLENKSEFTA
ncbi:MAG: hypothetical protein HRU49_14440 [Winogradskyella sp.]|nr:hypothetical protein [Winogradskyella sp.]NRB84947.1 hypothetical protein [Winogradskyella sp.]